MDTDWMNTDVLVIGGGLSGLTAAYEAAIVHKTRVVLLKNGSGASPFVHGFNVPLDPRDSAECFFEDTIRSGYHQNDPKLAKKLCSEASALPPFLHGLGIEFDRANGAYKLIRPLGATYPRVASVGNATGGAIMQKLRLALEASENCEMIGHVRALGLLTEDGSVCGARCRDVRTGKPMYFGAKAVVLATGGFCGIFPFSSNTSDIGGDGIAMAYEAGATLRDLEFIQFEPTVSVFPETVRGKGVISTLFYSGAVLRNRDGERFMLDYGEEAECVDKDVLSRHIYEEMEAGRGSGHGGVYFDATGVDADLLETTYPLYLERYLDCGIDIRKEPIEIAPAPHTSIGGVAIDETCATNVAGLFACGEVVGGIHGANRIGGSAGLETLVFGRTAGESAAAYAAERGDVQNGIAKAEETPQADDPAPLEELRRTLQTSLESSMNVIRDGERLHAAAELLNGALMRLDARRGSLERDRLHNDLLTGYLAVLSAQERTNSIGCHIRMDAEPQPEDGVSTVAIRKTTNGPEVKRLKRMNTGGVGN